MQLGLGLGLQINKGKLQPPNQSDLGFWWKGEYDGNDLVNTVGANAVYVSGLGIDAIYDFSGLSDVRLDKSNATYWRQPLDGWFYYDAGNPYHSKLKDFSYNYYQLGVIGNGNYAFAKNKYNQEILTTISELLIYDTEQEDSDLIQLYRYISESSLPILKTPSIIVRYNDQPTLSTLMEANNEAISMLTSEIWLSGQNATTLQEWKDIVSEGMDLGVWTNLFETQSAFLVNPTTLNNQQYYQDQDDLFSSGEKGIQEFFTYNSHNYCLINVEYPNVGDLSEGTQKESLDFSTISEGSDITITPTILGFPAVYLDSSLAFASDFPTSALDKWWIITDNGDGTWELRMNAIIPLEDYCGEAISGSNDYSGVNQLQTVQKFTFYPRLAGLKYVYQENIRSFNALGLNNPISMAEIEQGGYTDFDFIGGTYEEDFYEILIELGYKGSTKTPRIITNVYINRRYEYPNDNFRITGSSIASLSAEATIQAMKERIADKVPVGFFDYVRDQDLLAPLDLTGWQTLIDFLQLNKIPIQSYKKYNEQHFEKNYEYTYNIFPKLYKDIANRTSGTPDGFTTLPVGLTLVNIGGVYIDGGYLLRFTNATANKTSIDELTGFDIGDNEIKFYAKNDGTANDIVRVHLVPRGITDENSELEFYFYVNNSSFEQFSKTFSMPIAILEDDPNDAFDVTVNTWASTGDLDVSGITITGKRTALNTGYEQESIDLFARMTSEPDSTRKTIIDNTIKALKKAEIYTDGYVNLWDKVIYMHTQASHNEDDAKLNWKADIYNITTNNAPTFTVDKGWQLNGTNQYLGTGFNPTSIAEKDRRFSLNSGSLMVYANIGGSDDESGNDHGSRPTTTSRSYILISSTGQTINYGINGTGANYDLSNVRTGMFAASRHNSGKLQANFNGTIASPGNASNTLTNAEFLYGRHASVYSDKRYAYGLCAEGMTKDELAKFKEIIIDNYLTPINAL